MKNTWTMAIFYSRPTTWTCHLQSKFSQNIYMKRITQFRWIWFSNAKCNFTNKQITNENGTEIHGNIEILRPSKTKTKTKSYAKNRKTNIWASNNSELLIAKWILQILTFTYTKCASLLFSFRKSDNFIYTLESHQLSNNELNKDTHTQKMLTVLRYTTHWQLLCESQASNSYFVWIFRPNEWIHQTKRKHRS